MVHPCLKWAAVFGCLAISGCTLFVDMSGFSSGGDQRDAGQTEDANLASSIDGDDKDATQAPNDVIDAMHDAGVTPTNLLPSGGFEDGCGTWAGFQATLSSDPTARTGSKSCRICMDPGVDDVFSASDDGAIEHPPIGALFRAEAWVRTAPGAAAPPDAALLARTFNAAPFTEIEKNQGASSAVGETWSKVEATLKINLVADRFHVSVGASAAPGACFLVDDVVVERVE